MPDGAISANNSASGTQLINLKQILENVKTGIPKKKPMMNHIELYREPDKMAEVKDYINANNLDLSNPVHLQQILDHFSPTESIELTQLEPVPILQEAPKLETPEALEIAQKKENGEQRPEQGI